MSEINITILGIEKKGKNYFITTSKEDVVLDEDTIIKFGVFKDKVFTEQEFNEILQIDLENKSFLKAINFLSYRSRTEKEVHNYLKKNDLPISMIESIITKLKQFGYLDDYLFASDYLNYESQVKLRGPFHIAHKLREKGINEELINQVLNNYSYALQLENINKIIEKEVKSLMKYPIKKQKQLLNNKLLRNGYDSSLVYEQINNYNLVDESDLSLEKDVKKLLTKYQNKDFDQKEKTAKIITNLLNKGYEYAKIVEMLAKFE